MQPTALAGVYDAASEADSQATEGQNERNQPCACVSAPAFMLLLGSRAAPRISHRSTPPNGLSLYRCTCFSLYRLALA